MARRPFLHKPKREFFRKDKTTGQIIVDILNIKRCTNVKPGPLKEPRCTKMQSKRRLAATEKARIVAGLADGLSVENRPKSLVGTQEH
ncbi:Hypothetical predicted protein [Octopus vulgaris]|uniref:Uncharacterized protein n=1 Tax=Octopus vulgaris TaxID=6645 RepID=A0AA36F295_OCTVU|nr:Hypothetical predicted protein [Octopus vulgaris]